MKHIFISCLFFFIILTSFSQTKEDSLFVKQVFTEALGDYEAYENLRYLCKNTAGRICGTQEAAAAVEFTYQTMRNMDFDTVYLQETIVASWKRGEVETGKIISSYGNFDVNVCALGGSPGTGKGGILQEVIEVKDIEELEGLSKSEIKDKIIFFNNPFTNEHFYTFKSYSEVAKNRYYGPSVAAELGAAGVLVRSMTHLTDKSTHTGITKYIDVQNPVPSFAISTYDANILSDLLLKDQNVKVFLESHCELHDDVLSYNVIGEKKGKKNPDRIITVGGHIDAWDNGEGAHDDGVGCIQSIEVARLLFELDIELNNTLRIVMFMDEEMNQRGAKTYASETIFEGEEHYFAFESDRGGFSPLGFSVDADSGFIQNMNVWFGLLYDYGVYRIEEGYSGVDISPLKEHEIPLASLITDSQRYFDYQHAETDVFENVNRRQLQLGSAAMTSFVYFIDKYGY